MRLVEYLKQDRQFDEARKEEQKIKEMFQKTRVVYEGKNIETNIVGLSEKDVIDVFGGLVESFDLECCCEECAKYAKRIFSIDGKDKRFPRLPDCIKYYSDKHKYCRVPLNAFLIFLTMNIIIAIFAIVSADKTASPIILLLCLAFFVFVLYNASNEKNNSPTDSEILIKELEKRINAVNLWDK